jgi:hypothetical protein
MTDKAQNTNKPFPQQKSDDFCVSNISRKCSSLKGLTQKNRDLEALKKKWDMKYTCNEHNDIFITRHKWNKMFAEIAQLFYAMTRCRHCNKFGGNNMFCEEHFKEWLTKSVLDCDKSQLAAKDKELRELREKLCRQKKN